MHEGLLYFATEGWFKFLNKICFFISSSYRASLIHFIYGTKHSWDELAVGQNIPDETSWYELALGRDDHTTGIKAQRQHKRLRIAREVLLPFIYNNPSHSLVFLTIHRFYSVTPFCTCILIYQSLSDVLHGG